MSSEIRERSISRTRVIKVSDLFPSGESLDPIALLSDLLPHLNSFDIPLGITISDGNLSASYLLSVFVSREYEVLEGKVKFGLKKLDVRSLKINISFDLSVIDDTA